MTSYGSNYGVPFDGHVEELYEGTVGVSKDDPAAAWASGRTVYRLTWPEADVRAEATLEVRSDAAAYHVVVELVVEELAPERLRRRSAASGASSAASRACSPESPPPGAVASACRRSGTWLERDVREPREREHQRVRALAAMALGAQRDGRAARPAPGRAARGPSAAPRPARCPCP